jgi:hypothetical protein
MQPLWTVLPEEIGASLELVDVQLLHHADGTSAKVDEGAS